MQTTLTDVPSLKAPFWCFNGHVHTIAKSLFHHPRKSVCKRVVIPTPDDDFLELDVINACNENPVMVLFHGLEGSTNRYYMIDLMEAFARLNYSVVAVNFRSCGSRMNRQRCFYHSGATDDYATIFSWVEKQFPGSKMGAAGFSLGGNALLKSLGEWGSDHPVDVAVAVSVPYDLKEGSIRLSKGFNQIYERLFLKSLNQKIEQKRRDFPDLPHFTGSTLYAFDDQVTGPVHGFDGAEDYYATCSAKRFVAAVEKPTLLIHSNGDPLCPADIIPLQTIEQNPKMDYIITGQGGHVGFWSRPQGWLNHVIVNYFTDKID